MARDDAYRDDRRRGLGTAWLVTAIAVVALIVGLVAWIALTPADDNNDADPPDPPAGTAATVELPAGYVGATRIEGGVPVGFAHTPEGAASAAATWSAYAFVYSSSARAPGVGALFLESAAPLDPSGPTSDQQVTTTPIAIRGTVTGDVGSVEVLTLSSGDFVGGADFNELSLNVEVLTLAMSWSTEAGDWRIASWERHTAPSPLTRPQLEGFTWLTPFGSQLSLPVVQR